MFLVTGGMHSHGPSGTRFLMLLQTVSELVMENKKDFNVGGISKMLTLGSLTAQIISIVASQKGTT